MRRSTIRDDVLRVGAAHEGPGAVGLADVDVDAHIAQTRQLMRRIGAKGFPAFVLEKENQWLPVPTQRFLSDPAAFAEWLTRQVRPVLH